MGFILDLGERNPMKKVILTFSLLCLMLSFSLGSNHKTGASAISIEEKQEKNYAKWAYDDATHCLTISGTGETHDEERAQGGDEVLFTEAAIPYPYGMAKSAKDAEKKKKAVRKIVIEPGVTAINRAAFFEFTNLESVIIPDSVETISDHVFWGCSSLRELIIPDSVTSIGTGCFAHCKSLKKLVLGKNVQSIGEGNFCDCRSLRKITVHPENMEFITKKGCLYQRKQKILCFSYADSRRVSIEKGTKQIGAFAFTFHSKLQEVKIPASVTTIGGGSFYQCKNLRKILFAKKSKCREIESFSWLGISWDYVYEDETNYGCITFCNSLEELCFPESLRYIGHDALSKCGSLKKVFFGRRFQGHRLDEKEEKRDGHHPIEIRSFRWETGLMMGDRALKSVEISKKNPYFCSRDGLVYDKKRTILYFCPEAKAAAKIKIPGSVKQIKYYAFWRCKKVQSVVIPGKNTKIGLNAFKDTEHMVLYGKKNSKAQKYAKKHKMKFVII